MTETSTDPIGLCWRLTEAEFEKVDRQLTPALVRDRPRLIAIFTGLIERCEAIARTHAPDQWEKEFYNGIYAEFMWTLGEADDELFELIQDASWAADIGE
jgi:hypothetical protein